MSFAFMALYTGDYLRDTRHLSMAEHGCYLLLLMHCWDQRGPLPKDERKLIGICNARSSDEIEAMRRVVSEFFVEMTDGLYNPRMQKEIERAEAISGKRRVAGLARHGMAVPVHVDDGQRIRSARMSAARKRGEHTKEQWEKLVSFHDGKCCICGSAETMMVKDHILSVARGGSDSIDNLQPLCWKCNIAKGSQDDTDYRKEGWRQHLLASADVVLDCAEDVVLPPPPPPPLPPPPNSKTSVSPADRGSRLPSDWVPPSDVMEWARQERPDLDLATTLEEFRDYWLSVPGARGRKLDWSRTWRNWVRSSKGQPARPRISSIEDFLATLPDK